MCEATEVGQILFSEAAGERLRGYAARFYEMGFEDIADLTDEVIESVIQEVGLRSKLRRLLAGGAKRNRSENQLSCPVPDPKRAATNCEPNMEIDETEVAVVDVEYRLVIDPDLPRIISQVDVEKTTIRELTQLIAANENVKLPEQPHPEITSSEAAPPLQIACHCKHPATLQNIAIALDQQRICREHQSERCSGCLAGAHVRVGIVAEATCGICRNPLIGVCHACAEEVSDSCPLVQGSVCNHILHFHCMREWLHKENTCPLDRGQWFTPTAAPTDGNFPLQIVLDSNRVIEAIVPWDATTLVLKTELAHNHGIAWCDLRFITFRGKPLEIHGKLIDYGIRPLSVLAICGRHCTDHSSEPATLKIKKPTDTVAALKREIFREHPEWAVDHQHLLLRGSEMANAWRLVDFDHHENETIQLTLSPPKLFPRLALYTSAHPVNLNDQNSQLTLRQWGLPDLKEPLYVVVYETTLQQNSCPEDRTTDDAGRLGWVRVFAYNPAWRPTLRQEPSPRGLSMFLCCLYAFVSKLQQSSPSEVSKVEIILRNLLGGCPVAALALHRLVLKKPPTDADRAVIAQCCYKLLRTMAPEKVNDPEVFEQAQVLFAYVLNQAEELPEVTAPACLASLDCSLSGGRLVDPVAVPALGMGLCNRAVAAERFGVENLREVSRQIKTMLCAHPDALEALTWCAPSPTPDRPLGSDVEGKPLPPVSLYHDWNRLVQRVGEVGCMRVVPALSLARAPSGSITRDALGNLAVYTGQAPCSHEVLLYSPFSDIEKDEDPHKLAQNLARKFGTEVGTVFVEHREPQEAIIVCLDVSHSMNSPANFKDDPPEIDPRVAIEEQLRRDTAVFVAGWRGAKLDEDDDETTLSEDTRRVFLGIKAHDHLSLLSRLASEGASNALDIFRQLCSENNDDLAYAAVLAQIAPQVRRLLHRRHSADAETKVPPSFLCPITHAVMVHPVVAADGCSYERHAIAAWLADHHTSPMTGAHLAHQNLTPNHNLRSQILDWLETHGCSAAQLRTSPEGTAIPVPDEAPAQGRFTVFVNASGKTLSLEVSPSTTGLALKSLVLYRLEATANAGITLLSAAGKLVADELRVSDIGIQPNSTLRALLRPAPEPTIVEITDESRCLGWQTRIVELYSSTQQTALHLSYSLWDQHGVAPYKFSLWFGLEKVGDGCRTGRLLRPGDTVGLYAPRTFASSTRTLELTLSKPYRHRPPSQRLSRIDTVKQLFNAFVNRTQAYNCRNTVGLILFGSDVNVTCQLTPIFEDFREHVDEVDPRGDTCMWDAITAATRVLAEYRKEHPKVACRVLCLSDGEDTASEMSAWKVAQQLQQNKIMLDAICVGDEIDKYLPLIAKMTGGYAFNPETLTDALRINELETFVSCLDRVEAKPVKPIKSEVELQLWQYTNRRARVFDSCSDAAVPPRRAAPQLTQPVLSLQAAIERAEQAASEAAAAAGRVGQPAAVEMNRNRRVLREMRSLQRSCHPAFEVFPCANDMFFWRVIVEGPESTPYQGGVWLLYIHFPDDYPQQAPEMRFVTPIRHCNINCYGKICHSVFDRNWTADTTMETVLECIFGLLLNPDTKDPLDTALALDFYEGGNYEAAILEHVQLHARQKTRAQLRQELLDTESDGSPASRIPPETESIATRTRNRTKKK
eukprot:TRINITY_DN4074_c0_g1_i1.p1 TRINITY_DN4074_c0_g1~~TRINITY_DN4074_c0_g1_i1.p1  ORF type:complete len:1661 (-),score=246.09 TRINITY_DN4074_c0_g1_i1:94-5052(-)